VVGVPGAVIIGLGSILGTGVFVSLAIAAGVVQTGGMLLLALVIAALVALCNGLSSAQLAAAHPVAGGTYAYGYRFLHPVAGFTAGWMFLWAKSASAATAALGFAGYVLYLLGVTSAWLNVAGAVGVVVLVMIVVLAGLRRTNVVNAVVVAVTVGALVLFIVGGVVHLSCCEAASDGDASGGDVVNSFALDGEFPGLLHATALLFVAYTGYGRIATLGEEVREPGRVIPRAVVVTLAVTLVLYVGVAIAAVGTVGIDAFAQTIEGATAPLEIVAGGFAWPWVRWIVAIGAVTAMLGVLLNLMLGLSRVLLAMGRQRDMPTATARLNAQRTTPVVALVVMSIVVAGLCLTGDVKLTWSFSAFTVLVYYALTNLAALRLPKELRRYPRVIPALGLIGCAGLAWWVQWQVWLAGVALIAVGAAWFVVAAKMKFDSRQSEVDI